MELFILLIVLLLFAIAIYLSRHLLMKLMVSMIIWLIKKRWITLRFFLLNPIGKRITNSFIHAIINEMKANAAKERSQSKERNKSKEKKINELVNQEVNQEDN